MNTAVANKDAANAGVIVSFPGNPRMSTEPHAHCKRSHETSILLHSGPAMRQYVTEQAFAEEEPCSSSQSECFKAKVESLLARSVILSDLRNGNLAGEPFSAMSTSQAAGVGFMLSAIAFCALFIGV